MTPYEVMQAIHAIQDLGRSVLEGPHATSVLVICDTHGCEVGRVVETASMPVWKPKDAQFDPLLRGSNPYRLRGTGAESEVIVLRREPMQPVPLGDLDLVKRLAEVEGPLFVVGACKHGVRYAPLDDVMTERRTAIANHRAGKVYATARTR